jgi:hypothetical protein
MTAIVNDSDGHCPLIFHGLCLGGCGNGFDIGQLKEIFGLHKDQLNIKTLSLSLP